jgi:DNA-binding response OmpR family regulator
MKILVADDDRLILKMIYEILTGAGHEVVLAQEGKDALEKVSQEKPDLIVLDIILPGLLGTEILDELREQRENKEIPVLLISSRFKSMEDDPDLLEQFKGDDFLHKPFEPEDLLDKINELSFGMSRDS